ncbi:MAG TPA: 1-deoxy-D-xylulose-5-phosphate reductoisomerase [Ktedonobacterales bacterium]|nr:1-deoxy-D-xylulose-5-phosphate reductoisomerase [Ktedonobacterales bacterium]
MPDSRRRIAVLGSTGSIGRQTLDVARAFPDRFQVIALVARSNVALLAEQAREFAPAFVACTDESAATLEQLRAALPQAQHGLATLTTAATHPDVEMVVAATSGLVGVLPTLAAMRAGKTIALANKETLVMAGHLVIPEARRLGVEILPVDSEHSALWQCLRGERATEVRRLLVTASGGPFRRLPLSRMVDVTIEQAMAHPTWSMGPKITIDSATLMNKGLEVIEAHWLYDMPYDKITVVVHPQSVIHSMVEYVDDSIKMQASLPSMHLPIQYALSYPDRLDRAETALSHPLSWTQVRQLDFEDADLERFPCLRLAYEAGRRGGTAPAVLVGADERAVALFLAGKIPLTDIAALIETALANHTVRDDPDLDAVLAASDWAQDEVERLYGERANRIVSARPSRPTE